MSVRRLVVVIAAILSLTGCANRHAVFHDDVALAPSQWTTSIAGPPRYENDPMASGMAHVSWGEPLIRPAALDQGPYAVADSDGPYLLDSGDQLRVFVYGQPNLSRIYTVGHDGKISVPLIGSVKARGRTHSKVQSTIRYLLGQEYVRDPQVTVDIHQNRPFFILGQVRNSGQYPYVSGMTIETAIAIAGGYTERASSRRFRITRRVNGFVEQIEAPSDYVVRPGDTVFVFERFF